MSDEMPGKQMISLDRTLYESLSAQVQKGSLSKEQAYDQLVSLLEGSTLDLPSIAKLWNAPTPQDPPSVYSKIQSVLTKLVKVLESHKTATRIGHVFKDHFMTLWTQVFKELECHEITPEIREWIAENVTKPLLQVRDIRWILKDLEGYIIRSKLFEFNKYGIVPKSETMSRDNFYIVKKYVDDEEEDKSDNYSKWSICNMCRFDTTVDSIQNALENEAPFNVRDQPSNQTDELWVALKHNNVNVIKFLCEYEEKEGRPIVFTEEHAKYLRKLGHLDTLRTLMPQFLTKEEKDEITPPPPVPTLPEIAHDQFYETLSSGTELHKVDGELLFVDKPLNVKYFKYKHASDSVILFYNKETDLTKIEPELLELQKRLPKISFRKTTFDPPYYKDKYSGTNYNIAFFRNGCSLHYSSKKESIDDLHQQIQMMFYQTTIVPENEEFGKLRKKFENIPSDAKMSMSDVKEYISYSKLKTRYENMLTTVLPYDNTKADDYHPGYVFEAIETTPEEIDRAIKSRRNDFRESYNENRIQKCIDRLIGDREQMELLLEVKPNKPVGNEMKNEINDATMSRFKDTCMDFRLGKTPEVITVPGLETDTDTSTPSSFMYSRTILSRLERRYGNLDNAVRDICEENVVSPEYSGWFGPRRGRLETIPFHQEGSTFPTKDTPVKDIINTTLTENDKDDSSESSVLTKEEIDAIFDSQNY